MSSPRNFKNWLVAYTKHTEASEAPANFHFWTGVSTIAAVLQRKVWIDERIFQWTPNFYIIFVGPAGVVTKSTTIRLGAKLLREVEGVTFGPQSLTWQSMTIALEGAAKAIPLGDNGVDSELLHMSCITCSVGELGTFLDPSDRKMVDVFTDLWDGQVGPWEHATKTTGSTVVINPWLNIIAATTPSWLKQNFPESMIGGGLASRIVFVYGGDKRQYTPYPHLIDETEEYERRERQLIEDLQQMNELVGEYHLTPEAIAYGAAWYENHWSHKPEHLASERFEGYIARKQTHLHKLAIVLAAAKRNELKITEGDLINADKIVSSLEKDMIKVFQSIGASQESKHVREIINYILTYGGSMDSLELYRKVSINMSNKDYDEAISSAIKAGYIKMLNTGTQTILKINKVPDDMIKASGEPPQ